MKDSCLTLDSICRIWNSVCKISYTMAFLELNLCFLIKFRNYDGLKFFKILFKFSAKKKNRLMLNKLKISKKVRR